MATGKKRTLTEEQKQVLRDRLAAARAKKTEKKKQAAEAAPKVDVATMRVEPSPEPEPFVAPEPVETIKSGEESTEAVLKRALEAIEMLAKIQVNGQVAVPQVGFDAHQGRVTGVIKKYSIDPADYPSPVDRLKEEPRLAPFAFALNYDVNYNVTTIQYDTKAGINYIEPQFNLELLRVVRNDATGEDTGRRYVIGKLVMHEDPQSALIIARQNGLNPEDYDEKRFLNEMRYLMIRDWIYESFFTPISTNRQDRGEMVIGGKVVEFFEINDQDTQKLPFNELGRFRT